MMFLLLLVAIFHPSYAATTTTAGPCDDIDTQACVQMHQTRPDICQDAYLSENVCKRYCGKCPTTPPPTTVAPCDDIDTQACEQLHHTRPDICDDIYLAQHVCKRFCGNCPLNCYSCSSLVKDMSQCNATIMCDLHQDCYTMEVFDFDTSHGFRGGCIDKNMCVPQGGSGLFGRSTSTVQMKCCDTDNCNSRDLVAPPTTTATPKTTSGLCHDNSPHCSTTSSTYLNQICRSEPHLCRKSCGYCVFGK